MKQVNNTTQQEIAIEDYQSPYKAKWAEVEYVPLSIDEFVSAMKLRKEWFLENLQEHLQAFDVKLSASEIIIRAEVEK